MAFMRMRSTTPSKPSSAPIGIWIARGLARRRVLIWSRQRKKSAPARSILLTKAMRGPPYLFICRHTVSHCGGPPVTARNSATAESSTRHAMRVLALPDGRAAILGRLHQLVRQAKRHGFFAAATGSLDDPAHRQCLTAGGQHFNRNLVRGATDAARLHFDHRLHVVECRGEHLDGLAALLAGLLGDALERSVDDTFGGGLLAVLHDDVHELGKHLVGELRVREDGADG